MMTSALQSNNSTNIQFNPDNHFLNSNNETNNMYNNNDNNNNSNHNILDIPLSITPDSFSSMSTIADSNANNSINNNHNNFINSDENSLMNTMSSMTTISTNEYDYKQWPFTPEYMKSYLNMETSAASTTNTVVHNHNNNNNMAMMMNQQAGTGTGSGMGNKINNIHNIHDNKCNNNNNNEWLEPLDTIISPTSSLTSVQSPLLNPMIQQNNEMIMRNVDTNIIKVESPVQVKLETPIIQEKIFISNNDLFTTNSQSNTSLKFDEGSPRKKNRIKLEAESISIRNSKDILNSKKRRASSPSVTASNQRKRLTQHQKEAHNKIEKRYRININTKIAKLQQIIPWVASEDTAFEVSDTLKRCNPDKFSENDNNNNNSNGPSSGAKLNKSMILEKAVDYILYLQNNENLYEMEVQRLRNELESFKKNSTNTNNDIQTNSNK